MTCPHGMPTPGSCTSCMDDGPVAPPSRWHPGPSTFPAAYEGTCPSCRDDFEVGTAVRQWSFGPSYGSPERTVYTHAACGPPV